MATNDDDSSIEPDSQESLIESILECNECISNLESIHVQQRKLLDSTLGLGGALLCYINIPTLRLFSHTCRNLSRTCLHTTSDDDQTRRHKKHKQQTNTTTMVMEPLAPPAAWI